LYKQFKPLVTQVVIKNDDEKSMYKSLVNFCSLPQKQQRVSKRLAQHLFVVLSGSASVVIEGEECMRLIGGDAFGFSDLLQIQGWEWFGAIHALGPLEVIRIPEDAFELYEL
jgi:signal-transduction protein with cAMP-binding, CBS, and nucleotidyltransferase domain